MLVHVPVVTATAKAAGSVWRLVHCVQCRTSYVFHLEVQIRYKDAEVGWRVDERQRQRAMLGALRLLEFQLRRKVEPVPCPSCACFQPEMCEELRRRRYGWLYTTGMFLLTGGIVGLCGAVALVTDGKASLASAAISLTSGLLGCALCGATLGIKRRLWSRYDPNVRIPVDRRMELAQERALTEREFARQHPEAELIEAE